MAVSKRVLIEVERDPDTGVNTVLVYRDGELKYKAFGSSLTIRHSNKRREDD